MIYLGIVLFYYLCTNIFHCSVWRHVFIKHTKTKDCFSQVLRKSNAVRLAMRMCAVVCRTITETPSDKSSFSRAYKTPLPLPGLRAGMPLGNKFSYIVTYVISTLMIAEGQRVSFTRALAPVRRFLHPQPVWKHCYYSACPSYINCPRYATHTATYKIIPIWEYTPLNRKGIIIHKIRPHVKYPMLPSNKDLSVHSERINHYEQQRTFGKSSLSPVKNRSPPKPVRLKSSNKTSENVSLSKTVTLNSSNKTSDVNIPYQKSSSIDISVSRAKSGINSNNVLKSERMNYDNNSVLCSHECQNGTDHVQNTGNFSESTTVAPSSPSVSSLVETNHGNLSSAFEASLNDTNEAHQENIPSKRDILFQKFMKTLDRVERKFLLSVFNKLRTFSPENRKENGISFLQSGLFLHQLLMSLSISMDQNITREIEEYFGLKMTEDDKIEILQRTASWLPKSSDVLKFRWASRLVLRRGAGGGNFQRGLPLKLAWLEANETSAHIAETLNSMVLSDSGDSMHDTFSEEEVEAGVCAAALGTAYVRGAWRAAPTLLNGSLPFRDAPAASTSDRSSRYFRLNDVMAYSYLHEWNAEAIEVPYATPGLTLLILVPKEPSVGPLVEHVAAQGLRGIVMNTMRIAVTLPLYTLRMTLLLPNKLQEMGMPNLVANGTECSTVKLSHAVQRLMFWAEAGRNAFKDDGIEWDPRPELEIVVDRPYLFFVRWQNITIMNGVFAL